MAILRALRVGIRVAYRELQLLGLFPKTCKTLVYEFEAFLPEATGD